MNIAPFNILMTVGEIWVAPVGTAFPDVDEPTPGGAWALLGTSGNLDYDEDGIHVIGEQTITEFVGAGSTVARKISRTLESIRVTCKLVDMSLESVRRALNSNAITTVASSSGIPGSKAVPLYQGPGVNTLAVMVRGQSPYSGDADSYSQVELPNAYNAAGFDLANQKGVAMGYTLDFKGLLAPSDSTSALRYGQIISYVAAAA
jgi:hypothetical protein